MEPWLVLGNSINAGAGNTALGFVWRDLKVLKARVRSSTHSRVRLFEVELNM